MEHLDNVNEVKFCNDGFNKNALFEIINGFYPISVEVIRDIYGFFIRSFNMNFEELKKVDHSCVYRDINELGKIKQMYYIATGAQYIGLDFPIWLNFDAECKRKKIMIVGIDPLRSEEKRKDLIEIGTPYAFHIKKARTKQMRHYWDFFEGLSKNYSVYLTDTFKVFYYNSGTKSDSKNNKSRSYNDRSFTNPGNLQGMACDIHQYIFAKEYELVAPDLIITLGSKPRIWFSGVKNGDEKKEMKFEIIKQKIEENNRPYFKYSNTPILPLPHLTKRNITNKNPFFDGTKTLSQSYIDYTMQYLERVVNETFTSSPPTRP